jgi:CRP/FNR family cyclic AMP-dependent transcriptional regulator
MRLLDAEPDIGRFLSDEERREAAGLVVPVVRVPRGDLDVDEILAEGGAFGALILEGMLLNNLRVGDQPALRLLGPGDLITLSAVERSLLMRSAGCRAATSTKLALLGNATLLGARRWPRLVAGLFVQMSEQADRLTTQLAICQLPRVDQRLLAVMWLLAESWGRVTSAGTLLPLSLTHDALGALVGARRPTVTLALGDLADRGALVRQDRGWLLLEPPPSDTREASRIEDPRVFDALPSPWAAPVRAQQRLDDYQQLRETVRSLSEQHARQREQVQARLNEIAESRRRIAQARRQIDRQARRRPGAPSS